MLAVLTDFGISDNYNAVMEAVIRRVNRDVDVVYISPNSKNFNVIAGAYLLYTAYRYFRKYTTFLVVVDPGVGTKRRPLAVRTRNYYFVGPDNGVLYPAIREDGILRIHSIDNERVYLSKEISNTFHGRDIFSISAALLTRGVPMETLGAKIDESELVKLNLESRREDGMICSKVFFVDHFGNVALSLRDARVKFGGRAKIKVGDRTFTGVGARTFQDGENGLIIYRNGYGFLELGLNKADASVVLNVKEGDDVCIEESILEDFSPFTWAT
ncbi:Chlorinase [Metallosphaera sp. J1]|nr:Chlorinase [Metallosphaera javensis (ex Hofmann et al. 2022)]BCS91984.1 MAG: chlorinase [Metallosphaera javensis (ex Sakai et al. 2022)]